MFYSDAQNVTEFDAIRRFTDHEERFDGVGEYEVEIIDFPSIMNLDADENFRFPTPPMLVPNTPPGFGPGQGFGPGPGQGFSPGHGQGFAPGHGQGFNPGHGQGPGMGPNQSPPGPPPSYIPSKQNVQKNSLNGPQAKFVSPGTLRPCLFRYVYIWQTNGRSYWAYLVFLDSRSTAGWRWTGFRWSWFGLDLRFIESFICY